MKETNINKVYDYCTLLNHNCIKNELANYLEGYQVIDIIKIIDHYLCTLTSDENHEIFMTIYMGMIKLKVMKPSFCEEIEIQGNTYKSVYQLFKIEKEKAEHIKYEEKENDITLKIKKVEKREDGIIYTNILKTFNKLPTFNNDYILTDLKEKQLIFTKEKLEQALGNFSFNDSKPNEILSRFKILENRHNLKLISDYSTSTSIQYNNKKTLKSLFNKHSDQQLEIYLNGNNYSNLYNSIDGYDKIERIHDLVNGIISKRTENDIDGIRLGLLNSKCFDIKSLKGINNTIDSLIGEKTSYPISYLNYLKNLFRLKYDYRGNIDIDRDSLIKIITSKPKKQKKEPVLTKRIV